MLTKEAKYAPLWGAMPLKRIMVPPKSTLQGTQQRANRYGHPTKWTNQGQPSTQHQHWYETTLNYWMMVERYPNLKEEVGQFNSQLWHLLSTWHKIGHVVKCLLCYGVGLSPFCLKKKEEPKTKLVVIHPQDEWPNHCLWSFQLHEK